MWKSVIKWTLAVVKLAFLCLTLGIGSTLAMGRARFDCPAGYYLSEFSGIYGQETRSYSYNCDSLADQISDETCEMSESASTLNGDMYLTCRDHQYTAGMYVLTEQNEQKWNILCCSSWSIRIIDANCTATPFLNEFKKAFSFKTALKHQIIRKWQTIYDRQVKDRRWWLQVCPYRVVKNIKAELTPTIEAKFTRNDFVFRSRKMPEIESRFHRTPIRNRSLLRNPRREWVPLHYLARSGTRSHPRRLLRPTTGNRKTTLSTTTPTSTTFRTTERSSFGKRPNVTGLETKQEGENVDDYNDENYADFYYAEVGPEEGEKGVLGLLGGIKEAFTNIQDGLDLIKLVNQRRSKADQPTRGATSDNLDSTESKTERKNGGMTSSQHLRNLLNFLGLCGQK